MIVIKRFLPLFFAISFIVIVASSCVSKYQVPDAHPNAKIYSIVINKLNGGNTAGAIVVDSVQGGSEVVKLSINVDATDTKAAQYIYIVYATDNGAFLPLPVPTTINEFGTFEGGNSSTYSLKVPAVTIFTIDVFVSVRNMTTATNDVYKIWITDSIGSFARPTYRRILGTSTINLRYKPASLRDTYTLNTIYAGSQSSRNYGSFIATATQIVAMDSTAYAQSPKSADISMVTLSAGKKDNNSASLWLYSPADITQANPAVSGQTDFVLPTFETPNTTYFDVYSGATLFDSVKTTTLLALPTPTNKSIQVSTGGVYVFQTQTGKKGLIRVNSTAVATSSGGIGSTTGQNASVSIKVLN
ncbi:MAG: hypothetical protein H7282_08530 [Cytophagaceae bacterium]|nr:hypothetical protein [Cytophagaceae bacterium]